MWVGVGEAVKEDVGVEVTRGELIVRLKERQALRGHFPHNVQQELSTWTLGGECLTGGLLVTHWSAAASSHLYQETTVPSFATLKLFLSEYSLEESVFFQFAK